MAQSKGHKPGKFRLMGVGFWFLGELLGFVIGIMLASGGGSDMAILFAYIPALGFAALGAFIAHSITKALPDMSAEVVKANVAVPPEIR